MTRRTRRTRKHKKREGRERNRVVKEQRTRGNMHTHPTQSTCDMNTGNYGQTEKREWGKNAGGVGKPSSQRTTGAWQTDKLKTDPGQREMQPIDNAENGNNKDEA